MASRPLRRVASVSASSVAALARAGVKTAGDLALLPTLNVMQLASTDLADAQDMLQAACSVVCPVSKTALELLQAGKSDNTIFLHTTVPALDKVLNGGVPFSSITELVGQAGAGKTQTCMTLAVVATLPRALGGIDDTSSVLYLDTENKFSPHRLFELAQARYPDWYCDESVEEDTVEARLASFLQRVRVVRVHSSSDLRKQLDDMDSTVIENNVKLIVLDSMASLTRREFGIKTLFARQELLATTASRLKYIADMFSVPVLVTNQVAQAGGGGSAGGTNAAAAAGGGGGGAGFDEHGAGAFADSGSTNATSTTAMTATTSTATGAGTMKPALGNTWSHCVNTRLVLDTDSTGNRRLRLTKSPLAPAGSLLFTITAAGIEEAAATGSGGATAAPLGDTIANRTLESEAYGDVAGRHAAMHAQLPTHSGGAATGAGARAGAGAGAGAGARHSRAALAAAAQVTYGLTFDDSSGAVDRFGLPIPQATASAPLSLF